MIVRLCWVQFHIIYKLIFQRNICQIIFFSFQHQLQLQLQPVSEFLTSLIDTTISPKIDKKSEIQEEKAKQKEREKEKDKDKEKEKEKQAQKQKHENDQSFDFSLKNKKSEIMKIRSISRDEDDNES